MDYAAVAKTIQGVIRAVNIPDSIGDLDHRSLRFCASRDPLGQSAATDFENRLARRLGRKHAIAMSSGTAALHIAMVLAGVRPGVRVWVPAMGFVAGANAVRYCGGEIVFYDCDPVWGLGNGDIYSKRPLDVILATSLWGNAINHQEFLGPSILIEDASQALGSTHKISGPCGSIGAASVLSFNVNKIVTTGGGGALLCDDDIWAERARYLIGQARDRKTSPAGFLHTELGWNYRMPNICAALGLEQLGRLDDRIWRRMNLCNALRDAVTCSECVIVQPPPWSKSNYWIPILQIIGGTPQSAIEKRDGLMAALRQIGVEAREAFTPLHTMSHLTDGCDDFQFPCAVEHWTRTVCLPVRC